jgi:hypothetical protein
MIQIPASLPALLGSSGDTLGLVRRLETGAVLTGRVQRSGAEGTTPILIGSATLQLVLSAPVEPGTVVQIWSEKGTLLVEPQAPPGESEAHPPSPGLSSSSQAPLAGQGFSPAQILARVLQAHNLPTQLENLQVLQAALGNFPSEQAPVLALLLARNVLITPENLVMVRERLRARGNLGKELGQLAGEISNLLGTGPARGSERLSALLVRIQGILSWDQTGDLSDRIERLKDFLGTLEEKLLGGQTEKARFDFKALLLELDDLLQQAELPKEHPLRVSTKNVLHLLEGAQLSGISQRVAPDREAWVFWRVPFPGDPTPTTVELAVRGDRDPQKPERFDPRAMELLLQVDLSSLGPVRVRIRTLIDQLRIGIGVVDKRNREFVLKELPRLLESLAESGWAKVDAEVRVESIAPGSLADEIDPLKGWEKRLEEPSPSLDVKI